MQNPQVIIRYAKPEDAGLLAELGARTFSEAFAADNTAENMSAYMQSSFSLAQQKSELTDPLSTFFIAEVSGIAAGYAKIRAGEPEEGITGAKPIELVRLYVLTEWLGRGMGEALMRACIEEATRLGYKTIWLGVWERNGRAQAFYRKWNFTEVGEHFFLLGTDSQRDLLMERPL
jgi:ribosomal protein S18 acetylase RimI-like enzyme